MLEAGPRLPGAWLLAALAWIAIACEQVPPTEGAGAEVVHFDHGRGRCRQVTRRDPEAQFGALDPPGSERRPYSIPPEELCSPCTERFLGEGSADAAESEVKK